MAVSEVNILFRLSEWGTTEKIYLKLDASKRNNGELKAIEVLRMRSLNKSCFLLGGKEWIFVIQMEYNKKFS